MYSVPIIKAAMLQEEVVCGAIYTKGEEIMWSPCLGSEYSF